MNTRALDDDFAFILPQMRAAKGPISVERRRSLIWQAIHGTSSGRGSGKGRAAPQVMLKITSFSSSAKKLAMHLDYISRNGENDVFDADGNRFSQLAEAANGGHPREAIQLYGRELAAASQRKEKKMGRPRSRVSMNLMLSMPAGTDQTGFELAVGDFLSREYRILIELDFGHFRRSPQADRAGDRGVWMKLGPSLPLALS